MKRKQIWLQMQVYLLADKLKGTKSFNEVIHKALKNMDKANELQLEIYRLEAEKAAEPEQNKGVGETPFFESASPSPPPQIKCPALVLFEDEYYCFKNAPHAKKLLSLSFCLAHLKSFKPAEQLTRDYTYTTCGAEQKNQDGELWLKCPLASNLWIRWEDCKKSDCRNIKTVKAEKQ